MEISKTKKRRKSLDETLLNPIKSLMGIARTSTRRQQGDEESDSQFNKSRCRPNNDLESLKKGLEDPVIQARLKNAFLARTGSTQVQHKKEHSSTDDVTRGRSDEINSNRRKKSVTDIMISRYRNEKNKSCVDSNSFTNSEKNNKPNKHDQEKLISETTAEINETGKRKIVTKSSSFKSKGTEKKPFDEINGNNDVTVMVKRRLQHTRTKSESEAQFMTNSKFNRALPLLDNPLLQDTTNLLYKSKKKALHRTRSASDTGQTATPEVKFDLTIKEKIRYALGRSSSLKESREAVFKQDSENTSKLERSLKERIKYVLGRSSSFKDSTGNTKENLKRRNRTGSEGELYYLHSSFTKRIIATVQRASSLKERTVIEREGEQTRNIKQNITVKRSPSGKEKNSKRRVPNIMRRLSKQKNRRESDTEDGDMSNCDDDNANSDVDAYSSSIGSNSLHNSDEALLDNVSLGSNASSSNASPKSVIRSETTKQEGHKRNVSRSNSLQRKIDRKNMSKKMENAPGYSPPCVNRSMSAGNVFDNVKVANVISSTVVGTVIIGRQHSLQDDRSNYMSQVSASPMILKASREPLENTVSTIDDIGSRSLKKKKGILNPLRSHKRRISLGNNDGIEREKQLDNQQLEKLLSKILDDKMKHLEYNHKLSNDRCRQLSSFIESSLKMRLDGERDYKIMALVFIGEKREHGICFATQCCYEPSEDFFATATFQTNNMFVCACVFASLLTEIN